MLYLISTLSKGTDSDLATVKRAIGVKKLNSTLTRSNGNSLRFNKGILSTFQVFIKL